MMYKVCSILMSIPVPKYPQIIFLFFQDIVAKAAA